MQDRCGWREEVKYFIASLWFVLCLLVSISAHAQPAAPIQSSIPGYWSQTCANGAQWCVIPYGPGGTSGGSVPLAYSTTLTKSVATTSGTLISAGTYTRALQICTLPTSTTNIWLNASGGTAVVNEGIPVWAGGGCTNFGTVDLPMPTAAITAITDSGSSQSVTIGGG